jgi:ferredoxin-nitrite reductase
MNRNGRRPALVVVGTGRAGAKVVEEVLARGLGRFDVRLFGAESHGAYDRTLLPGVLGGLLDPDDLWLKPLDWYDKYGVFVHAGVRAEAIDRDRRVVVGAGGRVVEPYDALVLATGARPVLPVVEGLGQRGVFTCRTLDDCGAIGAYAQECDRAVVLGGGPLGLETARALLSHGLELAVVEEAAHLLPRHLDAAGAVLLRRQMESLGVRFLTGMSTTHLLGDGTVTGLRFHDGSTLDADLVVVCCGTRPNADEARAAGLAVEHGVVVDDGLRTSDPAVYAVGECAQHRGRLYGPGEAADEQARVLADVLAGARPDAAYHGSRPTLTLRVPGVAVTSLGDAHGEGAEVVSHSDPSRGTYKKLVLRDGKLAGAVLVGVPDHGDRLRRLFLSEEPLPGPALDLLTAEEPLPPEPAPPTPLPGPGAARNKVEVMKQQKDGLDAWPDLLRRAPANNWQELTEDDKQRAKWHGLFFRKQTPGHFMLRLRLNAGRTNARQLRVIADLSDEFGKGFCDLTTRQQIQLRWFTLADVPEVWRRLDAVGLHGRQTGMDNVRGVCGCPAAGLTPHELFDASAVVDEFTARIVGDREFTNLPRKFNVTITGCLENCSHTETQDLALVPAYRELDGRQVNGFNVLAGGKQGSGGYRPASPLDVFVRPEEAAALCVEVTRIFRDHGPRAQRNRARLAFLIEERGVAWFRAELERRWGRPLFAAGTDLRKPHHVDHLGIHPQKKPGRDYDGPGLNYVGLLVPVGRITTAQLRGVADLAERYGDGQVRVTVGQNLLIPNVPDPLLAALTDEPLFRELPYDPSPILRGLVSCTGNDYCHMALIETKGWAVEVARELEKRTAGRKVQPLTIHWSGCSAGCGLHQAATIGLQGCRSRVNGQVVDAAHVCVKGQTGPNPVVATDLMYDVPCDRLADGLEPLVRYLPR